MQFQMVITTLILTCLFAIPAQAIEEDEDKKKRAAASTEQTVSTPATQQAKTATAKVEDASDCESIPASFFKKLDMSSF